MLLWPSSVMVCVWYLNSGLSEVDPAGQVLSDEGIRVVCPLKHSLQSLQLTAVESSPVPALFPLLLLLCVHLFICRERRRDVTKPSHGSHWSY